MSSAGRIPGVQGTQTIIGPGAELEGTFNLQDSIRVDGLVRGRLTTPRFLVVGPQGEIESELIEVGEARIEGKVSGRVRASGQVYLAAGAVFQGAVETPRLVVEEGAVFREGGAAQPRAPSRGRAHAKAGRPKG